MTVIQLRRGTAAAWTTAATVLAAGEAGFETDTGKFKIGNGTTAWASLAYQGQGGGEWEPFTNLAAFPGTGDTTKEYVAVDTGKIYRWTGSAYVEVSVGEPTITAGTTAQYWRGDKSWQTLDKTAVGLGNVDNTSDATKNAASVTLTNKTLTSPVVNTPTGIVKGDVGLGNVDNVADASKPVSTAQAAADAAVLTTATGRAVAFAVALG